MSGLRPRVVFAGAPRKPLRPQENISEICFLQNDPESQATVYDGICVNLPVTLAWSRVDDRTEISIQSRFQFSWTRPGAYARITHNTTHREFMSAPGIDNFDQLRPATCGARR